MNRFMHEHIINTPIKDLPPLVEVIFLESMYFHSLSFYNRENETYNFLKRNVQFSLFFTPSKQRHLITI